MWIVFSYVWLPFMILPIYAALERIPGSLLEASRDLGARGSRTFRSVILPLALPGVVAGSIFTFSLTLGDYITPLLVGGPGSTLIGNIVAEQSASNLTFAAAYAMIPVAVMAAYVVVGASPRRVRRPLMESRADPHRPRSLDGSRRRVPLDSRS